MLLPKPMEPIADSLRPTAHGGPGVGIMLGMLGMLGMLAMGCSRPLPHPDESASQAEGPDDLPAEADLPLEVLSYTGILYGWGSSGVGSGPTQFIACDSGELFELSFAAANGDLWNGSCYGEYARLEGRLDRSFAPPRLIIDEIVEARWCEPSDCAGDCVAQYDSCYLENADGENLSPGCEPVLDEWSFYDCGDGSRCNPVHFYATESAGWRDHNCTSALGDGVEGDACEYPAEPGDVDTCAHGYRCWNPSGDLAAPGTCVPYCDLSGEFGPTCAGTCVRCSSTDEWGLCMTGCSGDACNVDAFC